MLESDTRLGLMDMMENRAGCDGSELLVSTASSVIVLYGDQSL